MLEEMLKNSLKSQKLSVVKYRLSKIAELSCHENFLNHFNVKSRDIVNTTPYCSWFQALR